MQATSVETLLRNNAKGVVNEGTSLRGAYTAIVMLDGAPTRATPHGLGLAA